MGELKVFECFAGYGSQSLALERLAIPHKVVGISEIDKYAIKAYYALHSSDIPNYGDISLIDPKELPKIDLFTYSFPCFTGDTLVLTAKGYKEIKDIRAGDYVLTHNNQYKYVLKTMQVGKKEIYKIKSMSFDELSCTENHKFLIRERYKKWGRKEDGKRTQFRLFTEPQWVQCKELTKNMYLGVAINQNSIIPDWDGITFHWNDGRKDRHKNQLGSLLDKYDFWWVIGRFLGDGWFRSQGGVIICGARDEIKEIEVKLKDCGLRYNIAKERTVDKIHIGLKELELFLRQFGSGAAGKYVPGFVIDLPINCLKGFVEGYMSADGSCTQGRYRASSVSKKLIYGVAQCVAKVYKTPYSIYHSIRKDVCFIEGRTCNQRESWQLVYKLEKKKQDNAFFEDGYIWTPINSIENTQVLQDVYDIEVKDDHSFTANGVIAHNCTDLSLSGKIEGMERGKTRSGLLYECEKLIEYCKPKYLLLENVVNLVGSRFKPQFDAWLRYLEKLGYVNTWFILNSNEFGIPQSRSRVFCVSILNGKEIEKPEGVNTEEVLNVHTILEDSVLEKYYIDSSKYVVPNGEYTGAIRGRYDKNKKIVQKLEYRNDLITNTLTTVSKDNVYIKDGRVRYFTEKECFRLMGLSDDEIEKIESVGIPKTKQYKLAGNSIVVPVLMGIFSNLFKEYKTL